MFTIEQHLPIRDTCTSGNSLIKENFRVRKLYCGSQVFLLRETGLERFQRFH